MARVLVNGEWFEQVEPSTFAESYFEDRIVLHAPSVYPEYYVLPFKREVQSEYGSVRPDLAFISKNYQEWRIVEVEMGYHSFSAHVEPQVQRLASASYGAAEAKYLCEKTPSLDFDRTVRLMKDMQPEVLVIVNEPKPDWIKPLSRYDAIVAVFELFRSDKDIEIFRVNGAYPMLFVDTVSECSFHSTIPRLLEVYHPEALDLPRRGRIKLRYNNCITEWERIDAEGKVWLSPAGRNPLSPRCEYVILRQPDSSLALLQSQVVSRRYF
jgi:hypothetical protein